MRKAIAVTAVALGVSLAAAACSPTSTQVVSKHKCTKDGKPAWCLVVTGNQTVYVPYAVYWAARSGYSYDPAGGEVHAPAPVDEVHNAPPPAEDHPVEVHAG
jgi:hypothetical protein